MSRGVVKKTQDIHSKVEFLERKVQNLELMEHGTGSSSTAVASHASDHILAGADEIDGDQLGLSWNPSNYTPATTPSEATSVDHLTAHLYGIDQELHSRYTDAEARSAIEDGDVTMVKGTYQDLKFNRSTAWAELVEADTSTRTDLVLGRIYLNDTTTWFNGSHASLDSIGASDHHARYTDAEAVSAVEDAGIGGSPAGTVVMYGGTTAPDGWLLCEGQAVSRTTYSDLYSAIGTNFGYGDGSTTFNVPDMRGMFPRGHDSASGNDPDRASRTAQATGGNTGDNVGSEQSDQYKSHSHTHGSHYTQYASGSNKYRPVNYGEWPTSASGGNETRPKNVYFKFIIKT